MDRNHRCTVLAERTQRCLGAEDCTRECSGCCLDDGIMHRRWLQIRCSVYIVMLQNHRSPCAFSRAALPTRCRSAADVLQAAPQSASMRAQALGIHDLALAYMVVSHSRRDPGEYLAELQRFAAVPEGALRAHALEAHLGRWPAALGALVAAGDAHADAALKLAQGKVGGFGDAGRF